MELTADRPGRDPKVFLVYNSHIDAYHVQNGTGAAHLFTVKYRDRMWYQLRSVKKLGAGSPVIVTTGEGYSSRESAVLALLSARGWQAERLLEDGGRWRVSAVPLPCGDNTTSAQAGRTAARPPNPEPAPSSSGSPPKLKLKLKLRTKATIKLKPKHKPELKRTRSA